jgi:hypothetical protein
VCFLNLLPLLSWLSDLATGIQLTQGAASAAVTCNVEINTNLGGSFYSKVMRTDNKQSRVGRLMARFDPSVETEQIPNGALSQLTVDKELQKLHGRGPSVASEAQGS